jgi:hypothetical protein
MIIICFTPQTVQCPENYQVNLLSGTIAETPGFFPAITIPVQNDTGNSACAVKGCVDRPLTGTPEKEIQQNVIATFS